MMMKMDEKLNNIVENAIVLKIDTSSMKSVKKVGRIGTRPMEL
jgi:hypothetical protein